MQSIGVLGAGTWGIALAKMLANTDKDVTVWSAIPEEISTLEKTRCHKNLEGTIPQAIRFTIFLGKMSLPGTVCCVLSTLLGIVCPIIVSKLFVRKFRITRLLVLGVDK